VAGTQKTLETMRDLTLASVEDPIVRTIALGIWSTSKGDVLRYAGKVRAWIQQRVGFVHEYPEQLHRPEWMLREIASGRRVFGDCDDMSMLSAALLLALGNNVRFTAVKPKGTVEFIHVFTELWFKDTWYMLDCTADEIPPGEWELLQVEV